MFDKDRQQEAEKQERILKAQAQKRKDCIEGGANWEEHVTDVTFCPAARRKSRKRILRVRNLHACI
jgi:hypothetical protein